MEREDRGKYCQLVIGPAGSGKSTYCSTILTHCQVNKRRVHLVNLDPAAEYFEYEPSIDIRDLITLADVMEELELGPNGGLVYCMEYFLDNLDWFEERLGDFDDDYLIIDCPVKRLRDALNLRWGYYACAVYLLDAQFLQDPAKLFAGLLCATSAMMSLEIAHLNILSKWDLFLLEHSTKDNKEEEDFSQYWDPDPQALLQLLKKSVNPRFLKLNEALVDLIEMYGMTSFIPFNIKDEDSVEYALSSVDQALQYGEDLEPKEPQVFTCSIN